MKEVTIGMGVVTVACAGATGYVALGGEVPSIVLVIVGTILTMFFGAGVIGSIGDE